MTLAKATSTSWRDESVRRKLSSCLIILPKCRIFFSSIGSLTIKYYGRNYNHNKRKFSRLERIEIIILMYVLYSVSQRRLQFAYSDKRKGLYYNVSLKIYFAAVLFSVKAKISNYTGDTVKITCWLWTTLTLRAESPSIIVEVEGDSARRVTQSIR